MADVIPLPTAAADPLPKRRWHGQYPQGVTPISRQRYKRKAEERQVRLDAVGPALSTNATAGAFLELYALALRGEVAGVVLAWEHTDETRTAILCGEFDADRSAAREIAGRLCDAIDELGG
jgi:hypothetical protein